MACQISISAPSIGLENWSEILPKTIILCPIGKILFFEKFNVKLLSNLPIIFLLKIGPENSVSVEEKDIFLFLGARNILDL